VIIIFVLLPYDGHVYFKQSVGGEWLYILLSWNVLNQSGFACHYFLFIVLAIA